MQREWRLPQCRKRKGRRRWWWRRRAGWTITFRFPFRFLFFWSFFVSLFPLILFLSVFVLLRVYVLVLSVSGFFIHSQSLPLSVSPGFSLCSALWFAYSFPSLSFSVPALPPVFSCFSPLCYSSSTPSLFPVFFLLSLLWFLGWFFSSAPLLLPRPPFWVLLESLFLVFYSISPLFFLPLLCSAFYKAQRACLSNQSWLCRTVISPRTGLWAENVVTIGSALLLIFQLPCWIGMKKMHDCSPATVPFWQKWKYSLWPLNSLNLTIGILISNNWFLIVPLD